MLHFFKSLIIYCEITFYSSGMFPWSQNFTLQFPCKLLNTYFDSDHSTVLFMNLLCNSNWWFYIFGTCELSLRMFLCNFLLWNNTWRELQENLLIIVLCALILAFTSWKHCLILEILSMEVKRSMAVEY